MYLSCTQNWPKCLLALKHVIGFHFTQGRFTWLPRAKRVTYLQKIFCDFVDLDPYGKERQDEEEGIYQLILLVYFPINDKNRPCQLSSCRFRFFWWARVALGKPVCGR